MILEAHGLQHIKIAISGKSGCGNTTVSRLLAEKTGLTFINFTFRNLATENNLTLEEVFRRAARDDSWDEEVDRRQVLMARQSSAGCVLASRLAIWMLPEADIKVYLTAGAPERVRRIVQREGGEIAAVEAFTRERDTQDSERYRRLYNIDNNDYSIAHLVIDTETHTPEEISVLIIEEAASRYHQAMKGC